MWEDRRGIGEVCAKEQRWRGERKEGKEDREEMGKW